MPKIILSAKLVKKDYNCTEIYMFENYDIIRLAFYYLKYKIKKYEVKVSKYEGIRKRRNYQILNRKYTNCTRRRKPRSKV